MAAVPQPSAAHRGLPSGRRHGQVRATGDQGRRSWVKGCGSASSWRRSIAPGENPTLALAARPRADPAPRPLGYDEAWIGEHHSAGSEIIASPEIFIATAAERTRHIKLGTGVVSVSYHNPLWVAERIVLLDHLTRGRFMLGVGPGSLPTDAAMIGIDQAETRDCSRRASTSSCSCSAATSRSPSRTSAGTCATRGCTSGPYSNPLSTSRWPRWPRPPGPRLAGRYGVGLLSIGATQAAGFDALALHWGVMEERAAQFGMTVDRAKWRLVGLDALAETREQAYKDVEFGIEQWFRYFQTVAAFPQMAVAGDNVKEMIDFVNDTGSAPSARRTMPSAQIERLMQAVQRRLRLLPAAGPRMGQPGGDPPQLRADRPRRHAGAAGPRPPDDRGPRPRHRRPHPSGRPAGASRRSHESQVPGRARRRAVAVFWRWKAHHRDQRLSGPQPRLRPCSEVRDQRSEIRARGAMSGAAAPRTASARASRRECR